MAIEVRTITADEVPAFRDAMMTTFGEDSDPDPAALDHMRAITDPRRMWAAFDGADVVGTAATFDFAFAVPGSRTLPMAGLTMVTVRPTHRRRGLLRELMRLHVEDAARRGFPISGLWASEAAIYGRFGFGIAVESDHLRIEDARAIDLAPGRDLDAIDWLDDARAREVLPPIYRQATAERPGALERSDVWWRERRFHESQRMRRGASRRRHVAARRGDAYVGYLQYRQRIGGPDGPPSGTIDILELIAIDARAEATLWQFALHIDLFPTVIWWNAPTDDVLAWQVADPRRIVRRRNDTLWLRIGDVPTALTGRSYAYDGALRIAVDDETWALTVEGGTPRCTPTAEAPELRMPCATLGALYLGGVPASRLARAGLAHGDAATLAAADRLLGWPIAPWCPEVF